MVKGAPEGMELWLLHPSTMYGRFLRGSMGIRGSGWDSSPSGYAGLVRWWAQGSDGQWNLEELLVVGTWPVGAAVEHQPHREALGDCLVLKGAARQLDLRHGVILYRNDAQAAVAAMSKESFPSPEMQESAVQTRINRLLFGLEIVGPFWHVPA